MLLYNYIVLTTGKASHQISSVDKYTTCKHLSEQESVICLTENKNQQSSSLGLQMTVFQLFCYVDEPGLGLNIL